MSNARRTNPLIARVGSTIRTLLSADTRAIARDYLRFRSEHAPLFKNQPKPDASRADRGGALIVGIHDFIPSVKTEGFLAMGLLAKGCRVAALIHRHQRWAKLYYRLFGITEFIYFNDFFSPAEREGFRGEMRTFFAGKPSFETVLDFQHRGVRVGEHGLSWVVRQKRAGVFDPSDPEVAPALESTFVDGMHAVRASERLFDSRKFDLVLFVERGYTPFGEIFDVALQRGLNVVQHLSSHRNDAFHFKRYKTSDRSSHPISLAPPTWERVLSMPIPAEQLETFLGHHFDQYRQGNWYSRQDLQKGKQIISPEEVKTQLGLDPAKKTAVVFSHILWDATFFYGKGIFKDYATWLVETVRAACANPRLNWIIKLHPVNVWRRAMDGATGELVEYKLIREHIGDLPPHVRLVAPETGINTASLFEVIDYGLTVRGTIGMELPMFGVPLITAGSGRYAGLGFTVDPTTRDEYFALLARLEETPRLTPDQIDRARRHAYAVFQLRPLVFTAAGNRPPLAAHAPRQHRIRRSPPLPA